MKEPALTKMAYPPRVSVNPETGSIVKGPELKASENPAATEWEAQARAYHQTARFCSLPVV